jgi:hypothetical protein
LVVLALLAVLLSVGKTPAADAQASSEVASSAAPELNFRNLASGWAPERRDRYYRDREYREHAAEPAVRLRAGGAVTLFLRWTNVDPLPPRDVREFLGRALLGERQVKFSIEVDIEAVGASRMLTPNRIRFTDEGRCGFHGLDPQEISCRDRFLWMFWLEQGAGNRLAETAEKAGSDVADRTRIVQLASGSYVARITLRANDQTVQEWAYPLGVGDVSPPSVAELPRAPAVPASAVAAPPAAGPALPRPDSQQRYAVVSEFQSSDGFWHSHVEFAAFRKNALGPDEMLYRFTPVAAAMADDSNPAMAITFGKGVSGIGLVRNTRTRHLAFLNGSSPLLDLSESFLKALPEKITGGASYWNHAIPVDLPASRAISGEPPTVRFELETLAAGGTPLRLVRYQSTPFLSRLADGTLISQSFRGAVLFDEARSILYMAGFRHEGSVTLANGETRRFEGQRVAMLEGGLPFDLLALPQVQQELRRFARITPMKGQPECCREPRRPADWHVAVLGQAAVAQALSALVAEGDSNPAFIAAVGIVHTGDWWLTVMRNLGYDLATLYQGKEGANLNPFDGQMSSLLSEHFYRLGARGYMQTAADLGLIDPAKVEAWSEILGDILRLPVDVLSGDPGAKSLSGKLFGGAHGAAGAIEIGLRKWLGRMILTLGEWSDYQNYYDGFMLVRRVGDESGLGMDWRAGPCADKPGTVDLAGPWQYAYELGGCEGKPAKGEWTYHAAGDVVARITEKGQVQDIRSHWLTGQLQCSLKQHDVAWPASTRLPRCATAQNVKADFVKLYSWCPYTKPEVKEFTPGRIVIKLHDAAVLTLTR